MGIKEAVKYMFRKKKHIEPTIIKNLPANRRYAARKKLAAGKHTQLEWILKASENNGKCHYCKERFGINNLTKDHIIPLSKGGNNNIANIVPACRACNSSKGNKDYETWIKTRKPTTKNKRTKK